MPLHSKINEGVVQNIASAAFVSKIQIPRKSPACQTIFSSLNAAPLLLPGLKNQIVHKFLLRVPGQMTVSRPFVLPLRDFFTHLN